MPSTTGDHVISNRAYWDGEAAIYAEFAGRQWAKRDPTWGIWGIPESEVRLLPDVAGRDVVELGCGTAYISAWLARRGARAVGVDNSPRQLATARRMQREHGLDFPLIQGDAEATPLRDAAFDLAVSEYGAAIWCDPYRWIPEAARLLRPGGDLVFLGNAALFMLTVPDEEDMPADTVLKRDYFGMHRFEWPDDDGIEFHIGHGDWIRLLRSSGFEIVDLVELRAPEGATTRFQYVSPDWARRWPSEEVWIARRL